MDSWRRVAGYGGMETWANGGRDPFPQVCFLLGRLGEFTQEELNRLGDANSKLRRSAMTTAHRRGVPAPGPSMTYKERLEKLCGAHLGLQPLDPLPVKVADGWGGCGGGGGGGGSGMRSY